MDRSVNLQVPINISLANELRAMVTSVLFRYSEEIKEAASMVASELVENAIKYGERLTQTTSPSFSMSCHKNDISIEVKSVTSSMKDIEKLKFSIDMISNTEDIEALYVKRLCALMENRPPVGRLGLYRICFEGRFQLSAEYTGKVLSVKATRGIQ